MLVCHAGSQAVYLLMSLFVRMMSWVNVNLDFLLQTLSETWLTSRAVAEPRRLLNSLDVQMLFITFYRTAFWICFAWARHCTLTLQPTPPVKNTVGFVWTLRPAPSHKAPIAWETDGFRMNSPPHFVLVPGLTTPAVVETFKTETDLLKISFVTRLL